MKIDLSKETIAIIKDELENADREISWELALYHKETRYWKERQVTIRAALSELRRVTQ